MGDGVGRAVVAYTLYAGSPRTPAPEWCHTAAGVSDPCRTLTGMEIYRSVREARRTFSQILSTAAYGDHRIVVVRHKTPVGAFVNMEDLEFLRRYQRGADAMFAVKDLELDFVGLQNRERMHAHEVAMRGTNEERRRRLAAEGELLHAERAWLTLLLALAKRNAANRSAVPN